jgi:hypothetical protein
MERFFTGADMAWQVKRTVSRQAMIRVVERFIGASLF